LGNAKTSAIAFITGVEDPTSPSGDAISTTELYKSGYLALAKNVANFISTNKQAPNYASSAVGNIIYNELVDATARILAWYGDNGKVLPNYVTISYGDGGGVSPTGTGINEKNTIKDLTPYLKSTTNCPVNNDAIKKVVDGVTKGLTSASAKAKAIFNYVRDYISYSFYYDTKYGAVNTLKYKTGNCVDQSHLLVAMFRTADLPARYVHGTCRFSSGSTYGHVWTQVLIDGKWTVADATSSRNSLGSVANWNTKSFNLHGIYSSLSF
jgi:transglutaminase-like putative cysteine protease